MKGRAVGLAAGIIAGVIAAAGVYLYASGTKASAKNQTTNFVKVIVSKRDIPAQTSLDTLTGTGQFTTLAIPPSAVVQGAVTDLTQLRGKVTAYPIYAGEQITAGRLQGNPLKLNALGLTGDQQAISISLEAQRVVNDVIQAGDHVAVYATIGGTGSDQFTTIVVPNIEVLKIAPPASGNSGGSTFVTLAASPDQAARIILAQEQGHVWLSLLASDDQGTTIKPVTTGELGR
jgi:Flp pilus assembly protein CpaB